MTDKWKAFPRLAAHFTGRWQTIRHGKWRLTEEWREKSRTKLYMRWGGGLCESISKIIHFTVATHFSLPRPIMALSGEGDRAGCAGARGRFCLICHQHPGDPHPLSCPLPTHSSIFLPIHGRTSVQLDGSSMNRRKWENHWISRPKTRCKSERSRREMISSTNWKLTPAFLFKLHQTKIKKWARIWGWKSL